MGSPITFELHRREYLEMRKQLRGEELERRARALGVDTQGAPITQSVSGKARRCDDHELQKRVLEAERGIREQTIG